MAKPKKVEKESEKKGELCDVVCVKCNGVTEHHVVQSFDISGSEPIEETDYHGEGYHIHWGTSYQIIRCCGCKSISYREESWFSEEEGTNETLYLLRLRFRDRNCMPLDAGG